ncbi:unnamed protein product [Dicrocoelium dendriticum]|nr:unnamed protein product [Dicrocoelium dendriticum]
MPHEWDTALPKCLLAYRAFVHSSTGQTPHLMMTAHELRLPSDTPLPRSHHEPLIGYSRVCSVPTSGHMRICGHHSDSRKLVLTERLSEDRSNLVMLSGLNQR